MLHSPTPRRRRIAVAGVGTVAVIAAAALGTSAAQAATHPVPHTRGKVAHLPAGTTSAGSFGLGTLRSREDKIDRSLTGASGPVSVMIELDAVPASTAFNQAHSRGNAAAKAAGLAQVRTIRGAQASVESHFSASATRARTLYRSHAVYSGVAVQTDASRLKALATLPGVKAIHRLTPKTISNSSSVPLIGAPEVWKSRGDTGQNVRVGIIDTGIDYTHADFGGPGTVAAYDAAKATNTFTPTAKVVGGHDFVGDSYQADPNTAGYNPVPSPDPNPLDCEGHGSHVSGTTGGLGVTKAGATYTGGYDHDIDPATMAVGPGVAPGAKLYALKVFGCTGSTNAVGEALDWAADPNGDGDVSDHLDVVNMSLGSSYGSPDDPDAVAADNLAALGTVVVASIGNSGDVYEVGGSPGNAKRVLGVAASDDGNDVVDGLKVDTPAGLEPADTVDGTPDNVFAALRSVAYPWTTGPGVTDTSVVTLGDWSQPPSETNNTDGCTAFSDADKAKAAGKVVMLYWLDGTGRRCGSAGRGGNARLGGAAGAILGSDVNTFSAGITGDTGIPVMVTVNQATVAINTALAAGTDVKVTMTNDLRNTVSIINPGAVDQLASFSSRGIGVAGDVKPDVTAPGVTTFSAAAGSGNEGIAESGTSMASPHVAGEAALVRRAHPGWTVEQVKAAIMNTATQDVFVGPNHTGDVYGPERVGSGRVKVADAVATTTLAYVKDDPGVVSVSFGPVAVSKGTQSVSKTVHVVNTRPTTGAAYAISYAAAHPTPGVTYTFSPNQISLPAAGSADVKVTATFTRASLSPVVDPTTETDPLGLQIDRSFRTDASGRMVLTPVGGTPGSALRVPVWSAPRAASTMGSATKAVVTGSGGTKTGSLALTGTGVDTDYLSTVSTFELQGTSPKIAGCSATVVVSCIAFPDDRSADLKYVGAATDAAIQPEPDAQWLSFGINTQGPWRTPASYAEFDVTLETDPTHAGPDAVVYNTRASSATDDYDYFLSELVDIRGATPVVVDDELVNNVDGSFDTDLFNSDSLVLPVALGALRASGLYADSTKTIGYWVTTFSAEAGLVDSIGSAAAPMRITVAAPAVAAYGDYGTILNTDLPGTSLDVVRNDAALGTDKPAGLLLLHHLNTDGSRAEVVAVKSPTSTTLAANVASYTYGGKPVFTAKVTPSTATGSVTFRDNGKVVKTVALSGGKATWTAIGQTRGVHTVTASYAGDGRNDASASGAVKVTVKGLKSTTKLTSSATSYRHGGRPTLTAKLSPSAATGTVTFRDGTKVLGTVKLRGGKATFRAPVLGRGSHVIKATYNGSGVYNPSTSASITLRVS